GTQRHARLPARGGGRRDDRRPRLPAPWLGWGVFVFLFAGGIHPSWQPPIRLNGPCFQRLRENSPVSFYGTPAEYKKAAPVLTCTARKTNEMQGAKALPKRPLRKNKNQTTGARR